MGVAVLPREVTSEHHESSELMYIRAHFERVVRSEDFETHDKINPDGNIGPEVSFFFVGI